MKCQYSERKVSIQAHKFLPLLLENQEKRRKLTSTLAHQERTQQQTHSTDRENPPRTMRVKHRPDLHSAEEAQEHIDREDPSDGLLAIVRKLVAAEIGVENSNGVHIPKASSHAAEGAKDHEPGPQAAFGVFDAVLVLAGGSDGDGAANVARRVIAVSFFFISGCCCCCCSGRGTGGTRLEWRA
jgi:hypothetical protein